MTDPTPGAAPSRTYTPSAEVEAVLDASFAAYGIVACVHCGRMAAQGYCAPCEGKNNPPLHGYVATVACPKHDCDELERWVKALNVENSDLARQVVSLTNARDHLAAENLKLQAHGEELAAAVRAGKRGGTG